jgi:hypothetical protein
MVDEAKEGPVEESHEIDINFNVYMWIESWNRWRSESKSNKKTRGIYERVTEEGEWRSRGIHQI